MRKTKTVTVRMKVNVPVSASDLRYMQVRLTPDSLRSVKHLAADLDMSKQAFVLAALNDFMRKHGRKDNLAGPFE